MFDDDSNKKKMGAGRLSRGMRRLGWLRYARATLRSGYAVCVRGSQCGSELAVRLRYVRPSARVSSSDRLSVSFSVYPSILTPSGCPPFCLTDLTNYLKRRECGEKRSAIRRKRKLSRGREEEKEQKITLEWRVELKKKSDVKSIRQHFSPPQF